MGELVPRRDNELAPEIEPTVAELLERARNEGWVEKGDEEYFGEDIQDILTGLYSYILQAGGDPDEIFASWGVAFEIENESE